MSFSIVFFIIIIFYIVKAFKDEFIIFIIGNIDKAVNRYNILINEKVF